jgi:hypothetical protein
MKAEPWQGRATTRELTARPEPGPLTSVISLSPLVHRVAATDPRNEADDRLPPFIGKFRRMLSIVPKNAD